MIGKKVEQRPFECQECGRKAKTQRGLTNHINSKHKKKAA